MPDLSRSSQLSSQPKKQQSISSFFGKPASIPKPAPTSLPHNRASTPKRTLENDEAADSSDDGIPGRKRARKSIGSPEESEQAFAEEPAQENDVPSTLQLISTNGSRKPKISQRTAQYLFSSSPTQDTGNLYDDGQKHREKLHEKFVKKLGRPDSMAEIKRKNRFITEETEEVQEADEDGEAEAPEPATKRKGSAKKAGSKLTPLERQVLEIKAQHSDTLLVVEVGYKFRFFGEDARTAAKELGIVCIPGKFRFDEHASEAHIERFASASVPVHRLHVHVRRLVGAGHKVGIVRQLETAALKAAGDNRSAPFTRKLTNLYTKGTYIDDTEGLEGPVDAPSGGVPATGYLLCLVESNARGSGTAENVHVGIVAVQPATGDVIYDDFDDGFMRSEIETRLLHIAPCEFLIVGELSSATEKLVRHLSTSKTNVFGDKCRVERVDRSKSMATESSSHVANFYAAKMKASSQAADKTAGALLKKVLTLPDDVTICLSAMISHMEEYGLEHVFDLTKYFQSFSARSHMLLNGTTLTSLEIYQNQSDQSERGSLFWSLNRTSTRFGKRLLRKWVGRPLLDVQRLEERIAAVEELKNGAQSVKVDRINRLLSKVRIDLERSLLRIYYGKCTRPELLTVLQAMQRISTEFASVKTPADAGFESTMISDCIAALPTTRLDVIQYLDKMNAQAAKSDDKYGFFQETEETEQIQHHKLAIISVERELDEHRGVAGEQIGQKISFVTVAGIEYLVEVENTKLKRVPASWAKISGTKKVSRFHTPDVVRFISERDQHKEALAAACDAAFASLLVDISSKYQAFRDCVQSLATLDCLSSLATIACQPGYVKPEYTSDTCIAVENGRHPMVEQLLLETYVPNDIHLSSDGTRALLITGPNMGGKSSYVRQVALIAIMGQIGSYVPATRARLGLLDAVFTRMGAFDNMMAGESTFMVELSETADILAQATPRSLVLLDELGRGTSTHDGVAIAQAVLEHVVRETRCLTLFITHYQSLSALSRSFAHMELRNVHMRFTQADDDDQSITFLYEVGDGVAHRSYGLNVARLANIPDSVLKVAAVKSKELEDAAKTKRLRHVSHMLAESLVEGEALHFDQIMTEIEQL